MNTMEGKMPTKMPNLSLSKEMKELREKLIVAEKANKEVDVLKIVNEIKKLEKENKELQSEKGETPPPTEVSADSIKPVPETPEELEVEKEFENLSPEEKNLDDARTKYAEEYKKFLTDRKNERKGLKKLVNAKEYLLGAEIKDSKIPPELKALEIEYEKATVEHGNKMFQAKQTELESSSLSPEERKVELSRYKQNEIFTRVIIEEQSRLNALKVENLPPKEKGVVRKGLEWYMKQPRWKKLAISTVIGTAIIATFSGSTVAAAGGLGYYAGTRVARAVVGSTVGQGAAKAYDWLFKEKSTAKRESEEKELAEIFKVETFDVSLAKSKKEYAQILEREQKAKRNRLITKAMIGLAAGIGTSIEMGHLLHHVPGQLPTSGVKPESLHHTPPTPTGSAETVVPPPTTPSTAQIPGNEPLAQPGTGAAPAVTPEFSHAINPDAVVHQGQGVEHAFIKQIENNPKLAEALGFKGGDANALHTFAGREAHVIATQTGYVDNAGHEVHVMQADKVGYELSTDSNGHPIVIEKTIDGKIIGTYDSENEYKFGKNPDNQYEKVADTTHHKIAHYNDNTETAEPTPKTEIAPKSTHMLGEETEKQINERTEQAKKDLDKMFSEKSEAPTLKAEIPPESTPAETLKAKIVTQMDAGTVRTGTPVGVGTRVGVGTPVSVGSSGYYPNQPYNNPGYIPNQNYYPQGYTQDPLGNYHDITGRIVFPDLSPHENAILQNHPEFAENPFNLSGEELIKAYNAGLGDMNHLFKNEALGISRLGRLKVSSLLIHANESTSNDPTIKHLSDYVILLKNSSGLEPKTGLLGIRSETTQDYIAKAYQTLAAGKGKMSLEKFQEILRK